MVHLIDKSVLVAEIERLDDFCHLSKSLGGQVFIEGLLSFLDTLEVKEVDLEKEIETQWNKFVDSEGEIEQFSDIAKHFFKLGLKYRRENSMIDKVQKICEEVERLQKRAEHNFDISLTENERQFWLGESNALTLIGKYIDTMQGAVDYG